MSSGTMIDLRNRLRDRYDADDRRDDLCIGDGINTVNTKIPDAPTHQCPKCKTMYFEAGECDWCPATQLENLK
jgi:hypothetical protein